MDQYCGNGYVLAGWNLRVHVCVCLCDCLCHLWPCAAARLNEFMSPSGVEEMPFRHMVPVMGSAPLSKSKLTSSKLPNEDDKREEIKKGRTHTPAFERYSFSPVHILEGKSRDGQ